MRGFWLLRDEQCAFAHCVRDSNAAAMFCELAKPRGGAQPERSVDDARGEGEIPSVSAKINPAFVRVLIFAGRMAYFVCHEFDNELRTDGEPSVSV